MDDKYSDFERVQQDSNTIASVKVEILDDDYEESDDKLSAEYKTMRIFFTDDEPNRTFEKGHVLLGKSTLATRRTLSKLDPAVKEVMSRKRAEELSPSLVPDAPPRKRDHKERRGVDKQDVQLSYPSPSHSSRAPGTVVQARDMCVSPVGACTDSSVEEQSEDEPEEEGGPEPTVTVYLPPAHILDDLDDDTKQWLTTEDKQSDQLLRQLLTPDHLTFDWTNDPTTFTARRETFTGDAGPTFKMTKDIKPVDVFFKFCDDEYFDLLTTQTNKYATQMIDRGSAPHSRLKFFKNVDKSDMALFHAVLILQGLAPLPVEKHYWVDNGLLTLKYFGSIMTFNRFLLLKRLLHFDSTDAELTRTMTNDVMKLSKIQPLLDFLKKKFSTLYLPEQNICVDESLFKWQGRLSFAQKIATKAAKIGVKSYELCDSATGYLWNFFVYTGRQTDEADDQTDETRTEQTTHSLSHNATAKIVYDLAKQLFNRGHTLVMDNFYNSPLLARYLKSQGTDCYGTLRVPRQFVPESIKSVSKNELRPGELLESFCSDLYVMMWCDTNLVSMVSTYHDGIVGDKEKCGWYRYKPQIVLDYNLSMEGVDKKDQLLSAFPIERSRNVEWCRKVFRRMLNVTLLNAYIIYKTYNKHGTQRAFRYAVAEDIVKIFKPVVVERPLTITTLKSLVTGPRHPKRPILVGNHFVGTGSSRHCVCVWCKKCRSKYICKQCGVTLCLLICFEAYHTAPEPKSS